MKTRSLKTLLGLLVAWLLLPALIGCGHKQASPDVGKSGETQKDALNRRLNDPSVSEAEKQQLRQHMGQGTGTNTGSGQ